MLPDRETQVRFFKSLVVGGTAFGVQYLVLWILKPHLRPLQAYSWAYGFSVATHYSLNRFWALRSARTDAGRQFLEYLGTALIGYLIQRGIAWFCLTFVHMPLMWVPVFAVPPSTLAVIAILNYRVFRRNV